MTTVPCKNCGDEVQVEEPDWEETDTYIRLTEMRSHKERIDYLPEGGTHCSPECAIEYIEEEIINE